MTDKLFRLVLEGVPDDATSEDMAYVEALVSKLEEYVNIFYRKHRDYGPGNISAFGELGVVVRLSDKMERLKNLIRRGIEPDNESLRDTVLDILGYAAILLMVMDGDWYDPSGLERNKEAEAAMRAMLPGTRFLANSAVEAVAGKNKNELDS